MRTNGSAIRNPVRNQIALVVTLVQRAESGQRGYLLTNDSQYLAPYDAAVKGLPNALAELDRQVYADNVVQQRSVGRMHQLVNDKLRELKETIDEQRAGRHRLSCRNY